MGLPLNIDWQQILLHLFNFLILAGGLYLLLYKPVKQFMDKREQTYQAMNDAADQKAQQAQQAQQQDAQRLEQLNKEIAKKNSEAAQQASLAAQKILDEAEAEKAHILAAAQQAAEQEKARIVSQASREIEQLAMQAIDKAVRQASKKDALDAFLDSAQQTPKED